MDDDQHINILVEHVDITDKLYEWLCSAVVGQISGAITDELGPLGTVIDISGVEDTVVTALCG